MKYAIISDIHGNLEAFEAVLDALAAERPDKILCLGDIVGYGANPKECIDLANEKTSGSVAGNHDWGVAGRTDFSNFNRVAQTALEWTAAQLSADHLRILADLPLTFDETHFLGTHATPTSPQDWNYIFTALDAAKHFQKFEQPICFVGHSHIPMLFRLNISGAVSYATSFTEVLISDDSRYLINVGSIGQPRDNDPRAAYGILDTNSRTFNLKRTPYNVTRAQNKILAAGLPPVLAGRLGLGW